MSFEVIVEKYDNQDLSSQNRVCIQERDQKTFGRVFFVVLIEVDFYPENFSIEETPNQQFEVFVESSTLAIGDGKLKRMEKDIQSDLD